MSADASIPAEVVAVNRDAMHRFSKTPAAEIVLVEGIGVAGDAHAGVTVQHLSRMRRDPSAPNLRQVHLIAAELLDELTAGGFSVAPGRLGENITTRGVDLLGLPAGTQLQLGGQVLIEITGLRNPCFQLDDYQPGLQRAVLDRGPGGELIRRAGVMAVVRCGGAVRAGDPIAVTLPAGDPRPLQPV
jgi:MOSC domain-containing protein YiiM